MTVKELRDILKDFDDDMEVLTQKTELPGNAAFVRSIREDSFGFFGVSIPFVLLTDELKPQERR